MVFFRITDIFFISDVPPAAWLTLNLSSESPDRDSGW
jgi:hypothetical protein